MRTGAAFALGLCLAISGCATSEEDASTAPAPFDDSRNSNVNGTLPDVANPRLAPSLATPPDWRLGDWYRFRLVDNFTSTTYEFTRIVAGGEGENYFVGMPRDEWINDILILHVPGYGEVSRSDLSFEVHDARFHPLKFPLTDGITWTTEFEGRPVTATAKVAGEFTVDVHLVSPPDPNDPNAAPQDDITLTYDASVGEIVKFDAVNYASYELIDHGTNFTGVATVPHGHDLVFIHGRVAGALGPNLQPSGSVTDEIDLDTTYDRVSFVIFLGSLVPEAPQGFYKERVTAPDGTVYEHQVTPADSPGFKLWTYMHEKPGGKWTFEHTAAGPGVAFTEGIAYHVYDVELPGGRILPSTGEHQHGG